MNWKYIATAIISFGVGFLFGWDSALESFRNYIVAILSWGLIFSVSQWGFNMWWEWRKEKKGDMVKQKEKLEQEVAEKCKEKEKNRLEHSKKLVEIYLNSKTDTHIDFDRDGCGLQIQIKQLQWDYQIPFRDVTFCKFFDFHLMNEYKSIWDNIKERDEAIKKHNIESQRFIVRLRKTILTELHQKIPGIIKWDGTGEPPSNYYREYLLSEVVCRIETFYKYLIEINRLNVQSKRDGNLIICYGNNDWVKSNLELEVIKSIIIDAIIKEDFDSLKKLYDDAKNKHERFKEDIVKLKCCIESNVSLKGECDICKDY